MSKKKVLFSIIFFVIAITLIFSTQSYAATVNNLRVTVDGTRAYLNWDRVENVTGYDVYVKLPGYNEYGYLGAVNGNGATVTGFTVGKTYSVKVKAYKTTNGQKTNVGDSNEVSFTAKSGETLQVPSNIGKVTGLKITSNAQKAYLSWNAVSDVNGYDVYVKLPGYNEYGYIGSVRNNAAIVTGFSVGKTYSMKVRAYKTVNGQKVQGDYSDEATFTAKTEGITLPLEDTTVEKVTGLEANVVDTKVELEWNKVSGAAGYEIEVKTHNGTKTYTTTSTSKTVTGITDSDYNYTATVKAYKYVNGAKKYGTASKVSFKAEDVKPDKVKNLSAEVDGTKVYLDWNKVSNVSGYEVRVTTHSGTKTYTTTSTSKTVTGITDPDYNYTAKVRAYNYVGSQKVYGDYSSKVSFKAEEKAPDKVKDLDVDVRSNRAYLDWKKVSGADGYEVCISIPGLHDVDIITTKNNYETAISDTFSDYKAKVRAYKYINGKKEYGAYSSTVSFRADIKQIDKVTGLKATVSGTTANITWNKVSGADGYEISTVIPGLHETTMTSKTNSYKLTGMIYYNSSYTTRVRAYKMVNGKKQYGDYSTSIKIYRK